MQESASDRAERTNLRRALIETLFIHLTSFAVTDSARLARLDDIQLLDIASSVIDSCNKIELIPVPHDWQPQSLNFEGLGSQRSTCSDPATAPERLLKVWNLTPNLTSNVVETAQVVSETAIGVYDDLTGHWIAPYVVLYAFCTILHVPTTGFRRNEALTFIGLWTKWKAGGTRFTTEDGYHAVAQFAKDSGWGEVDGPSYQIALIKLATTKCIIVDCDLVSFPATVEQRHAKSGH